MQEVLVAPSAWKAKGPLFLLAYIRTEITPAPEAEIDATAFFCAGPRISVIEDPFPSLRMLLHPDSDMLTLIAGAPLLLEASNLT